MRNIFKSQSPPQEGQRQSKHTNKKKEGERRYEIGKVRSHPNGNRDSEMERDRRNGKIGDLEGRGTHSSGCR